MAPRSVLKTVFRFLDIDEEFVIPDLAPKNAADAPSKTTEKLERYLRDYFAPHNQALYELLDIDYDW